VNQTQDSSVSVLQVVTRVDWYFGCSCWGCGCCHYSGCPWYWYCHCLLLLLLLLLLWLPLMLLQLLLLLLLM
jgi:hypothetical protein